MTPDFRFNKTAPPGIYTLSLHDALPICSSFALGSGLAGRAFGSGGAFGTFGSRSEEHTSELQSRLHLVCRLLLEKKKVLLFPLLVLLLLVLSFLSSLLTCIWSFK